MAAPANLPIIVHQDPQKIAQPIPQRPPFGKSPTFPPPFVLKHDNSQFSPYKHIRSKPFFHVIRPVYTATRDISQLYARVQTNKKLAELKLRVPNGKIIPKPPLKATVAPVPTVDRFSFRFPLLGGGTYGTVYAAFDNLRKKPCAIKINNPDYYDDAIVEERNYTIDWKDVPHVMQLEASYCAKRDKAIGLVMKKIPQALDKQIKAKNGLSLQEVVTLLRQYFVAYREYGEKRKLIHGDFKPNNVSFDSNQLTIFDLGLAHRADQPKFGKIGALAYSAPELFTNNRVYGCQVDVWSFGCVAYQAFTNKVLFNVENSTPIKDYIDTVTYQIGMPPKSYMNKGFEGNFPLKQHPPHNNWERDICSICSNQHISPATTSLFTKLLSRMLTYENRTSADEGIALCDEILNSLIKPAESKT